MSDRNEIPIIFAHGEHPGTPLCDLFELRVEPLGHPDDATVHEVLVVDRAVQRQRRIGWNARQAEVDELRKRVAELETTSESLRIRLRETAERSQSKGYAVCEAEVKSWLLRLDPKIGGAIVARMSFGEHRIHPRSRGSAATTVANNVSINRRESVALMYEDDSSWDLMQGFGKRKSADIRKAGDNG